MDFAAASDRARTLWDTFPALRYAFADLGAFAQTLLADDVDLTTAHAFERDVVSKQCVAGAERLAITRNPTFAAPQSKLFERQGARLIVWLYGPIGYVGGIDPDEVVCALKRNADAAAVVIRISSHGGIASAGDAIEFALSRFRGRTVAIVDHFALSAGAHVACVCDHVVMRSNAVLMLHNSHVTIRGDSTLLIQAANDMRNGDTWVTKRILSKRRSRDHAAVRDAISGERYLSASEAISLGLCDQITRPLAGSDAIISKENFGAR